MLSMISSGMKYSEDYSTSPYYKLSQNQGLAYKEHFIVLLTVVENKTSCMKICCQEVCQKFFTLLNLLNMIQQVL